MLKLRRFCLLAVLGIALAAPASAAERRVDTNLWEGVLALWNQIEMTIRGGLSGAPRGLGHEHQGSTAIRPTDATAAPTPGANSDLGLGIDPSGNS